jgi:hypothetical protein
MNHEPLGVWYWNGEDPADELERRIAAICLHYGITNEDIGGRLCIDSGRDVPIRLVIEENRNLIIATPLVDNLLAEIKTKRIDVMIIDPFVASHRVSENESMKIEAVTEQWKRICEEGDCSVELVHHTRKLNGNVVTIDDGRGSTALVAAMRSARLLAGMGDTEADKHGIDDPRAFFRIENGKSNMMPASRLTRWHQLVSVPLGNATATRPEDCIGVVTHWIPPSPIEGVSDAEVDEIVRRIKGGDYREDQRADAWAGNVVAEVLGLDPSDKGGKAKASSILKELIARGRLRIEPRKDAQRKERKFVVEGVDYSKLKFGGTKGEPEASAAEFPPVPGKEGEYYLHAMPDEPEADD